MIYVTSFNAARQCTSQSANSGFVSLEQVVMFVGDGYTHKARHMVVYAGVVFSDFAFQIDEPGNNAVSCMPTQQSASG